MSDDLQARLRRLGVVKGTRNLKSAPTPADKRPSPTQPPPAEPDLLDEDAPLEQLFPGGQLVETEYGACFVVDKVYPLHHKHGHLRLAALQHHSLIDAAQLTADEQLAAFDHQQLLFLDTETTGLAGAGILPFLLGLAFYEQDAFVVRQYFLRDHADEATMLHLLADMVSERPLLVTFNGRSFDLPLLDNRYLMNRLNFHPPLSEQPHFDLLHPARRLWRARLESCALSSLEQQLLGVERTQADVPGWAIPRIYFDYLREGDARPLRRVFYHNRIDMLSMPILAAQILRQFSQPQADDPPLDLLSLARWQAVLGQTDQAEVNFRLALESDLPLDGYQQALAQLALLLKRADRRAEAVPLWQQLAVTTFDDISAHIELAKYYEWHQVELTTAQNWTQQALALLERQTAVDEILREEVLHRLARLERKLDGNE